MKSTLISIVVTIGAMAGAYLGGEQFFFDYTQQSNWRQDGTQLVITKEDSGKAAMLGAGVGGSVGWLMAMVVAATLQRREGKALESQLESILGDSSTDEVMREATLMVLARTKGSL